LTGGKTTAAAVYSRAFEKNLIFFLQSGLTRRGKAPVKRGMEDRAIRENA